MNYTYSTALDSSKEYGQVKTISHPIINTTGLPGATIGEMVVFESGPIGYVVALYEDHVQILQLDQKSVSPGEMVSRCQRSLEIGLSETHLLGSVINPKGEALIGDNYEVSSYRNIFVSPKKITERVKITKQLVTGVSMIDVLLPLGRGQRELILGDRKTGKTHTVINIIRNQKQEGVVVVYALIGKSKTEIKKIYEIFAEEEIIQNSVIVATAADDSPALIDLTPDAAMSVAEYISEKGQNVLVVFDDLTTHAKYYREIALLAKRFPGRESYPGDMFYRHAHLLERAGNFVNKNRSTDFSTSSPANSKSKSNSTSFDSVSITCLPLAETISNRLNDYIISNLISITDGHLLFDSKAFNSGRRPSIDIFLSVTRVGKQTQDLLSRQLNEELYLLMSNYRKALGYKHFGSELGQNIQNVLNRGEKIYEFFSQTYKTIIPSEVQVILLVMISAGTFDKLPAGRMGLYRDNLLYHYVKGGKLRDLIQGVMSKSTDIQKLKNNISQSVQSLLEACTTVKD